MGTPVRTYDHGTVVDMQTRCTQQPTQVMAGETVTFEYRGRRFVQVFP